MRDSTNSKKGGNKFHDFEMLSEKEESGEIVVLDFSSKKIHVPEDTAGNEIHFEVATTRSI